MTLGQWCDYVYGLGTGCLKRSHDEVMRTPIMGILTAHRAHYEELKMIYGAKDEDDKTKFRNLVSAKDSSGIKTMMRGLGSSREK